MSKRAYTHVQRLLPEIQTMVAAGKTQREIAEHYGLSSKKVVKKLLERERKKIRKMEKIIRQIPPLPKNVMVSSRGLKNHPAAS